MTIKYISCDLYQKSDCEVKEGCKLKRIVNLKKLGQYALCKDCPHRIEADLIECIKKYFEAEDKTGGADGEKTATDL